MAQGWQFIHAYLTSEGNSRRWANTQIGELPEEVKSWRSKVKTYEVNDDG